MSEAKIIFSYYLDAWLHLQRIGRPDLQPIKTGWKTYTVPALYR